jgi:hypothetical protein
MKKKAVLIGIIGVLFFIQLLSAQTWTATKRVTWNSFDSYDPAIVVNSHNHLHVVWEDWSPGTVEIFYKRSTDGGTTWITRRLTWSPVYSVSAAIAVDSSNNIHVVWYRSSAGNDEIYYKKSTDGGLSWTSGKRLTWNSGNSRNPAIAVDSSNNIHVVWFDNASGNYEIYYKRSTDGGTTWMLKRMTWNSGDSEDATIAIDSSDNIHVVWFDNIPGNNEIYYKVSTNGGLTWSGARRITWNLGDSRNPAIALDSSNNIHVTWHDGTPSNYEIYYRKSTNGGVSWGSAKRLTWNSGASYDPAIAMDSDNHIHVIWYDNTSGNEEIFYLKSTDGGGASWTTKRLTYSPGDSLSAGLAVDSNNNIHVVWFDNTPGNYEIYYKKGIQ